MHTDTPSNEMPTGDGNPTAGNTDMKTVANSFFLDKTFACFRASFARDGHGLHRTPSVGSGESYWAERLGLIKYLPTVDGARRILEAIGGRL